ncbi:ABC transporter substrate-binding protein [Streptomonospora wellingtoniae]|uniref:Sugar ABC transporter substrate-binding protein n=1 Tax=Streptomonospora wellingtoniae TaxID=3075544 RepID=A0ABU2KUQ5_9ACTN|nr:sugar ABC transporter substrate-binding protein [Streptomonospora sp. DSM 45055]MDT0303029.1 sugar ABC transporter substrate-binding protein [Streptomonospora sp. DSM 45055]
MTPAWRTPLRGLGMAAALLLGVTACGSGGGSSAGDVRSALEEGGKITVWAWEPTLKSVVEDFEKEHPNVDVELVNAGTGPDQYSALQNAVKAGSGVPDLAQIEYFALSQFAVGESVADLSPMGAADLDGTFSKGPWSSVNLEGGIYGMPMDSGPMALFYNKDVFDEHGIEVPATWEEYIEAGRRLHKADPDAYITSDTGDAGLATSLIWQAGGQPFTVDGTDVTVDFTDEGSTTYAETWQQLLDDDLVAPVNSWTDEWFQGMADGTIASVVAGAWMPANLESSVADGAGSWRVAPMPQWEEGASASAENGGSSLAVPEAGENKELAYAFAEYATTGDGVATRLAEGAFPATTADLEDERFLSREFEYFGGQKANEVFAESAGNVVEGWSYLPYQVYANEVFNDTVGKAYVSDTTLQEGLAAWQEQTVEYGNQQGFTVNE